MSSEPSNAELAKRGASAWQGSVEAVLSLLIAAGVGYWVDGRLGTSPRWLIVGVVIGFGSFVLRLWRMRALFDEVKDDGKPGS